LQAFGVAAGELVVALRLEVFFVFGLGFLFVGFMLGCDGVNGAFFWHFGGIATEFGVWLEV
jgi:hypothetical protein